MGKDADGNRSKALDIIIAYLNKNIERLAMASPMEKIQLPPIPPIEVPPIKTDTYEPGKLLYINSNVVFEGREQFETEMRDYLTSLDEPVVVAINYSQDTDTESYLQRAKGGRPKGLPEGSKYIAITLVNIPGSVKEQVFGPEELMGMKSLDELLKRLK